MRGLGVTEYTKGFSWKLLNSEFELDGFGFGFGFIFVVRFGGDRKGNLDRKLGIGESPPFCLLDTIFHERIAV